MAHLFKETEYVRVKDKVTGEELSHPVPKSWIGTYLADGLEPVKATRQAAPKQDESGEKSADSK